MERDQEVKLQAMQAEIKELKSQPLPADFFEAEDKKQEIINLRFRILAMYNHRERKTGN